MKSLPEKVLIVEDEVLTKRYLIEILHREGIEVVGAYARAQEVLDAFAKGLRCDVVLMDINLEGNMDGITLARKILYHHTTAIMFITAYSDMQTLSEALELSPYGYILKPFDAREVTIALRVAYARFQTFEAEKNRKRKYSGDTVVINDTYRYEKIDKHLFGDGNLVYLNNKQQKLMDVLVRSINHVVSYDTLIEEIWDGEAVSGSTLRTLIYSLRKTAPGLPVHSYSKKGYILLSSSFGES